jgi:hypothetical protein
MIGAADSSEIRWARVGAATPQTAPAAFVLLSFGLESVSGTNTAVAAGVPGTAFRLSVENQ